MTIAQRLLRIEREMSPAVHDDPTCEVCGYQHSDLSVVVTTRSSSFGQCPACSRRLTEEGQSIGDNPPPVVICLEG